MSKKERIPYKVISILLKLLIITGATVYIISRIRRQDYIDFRALMADFGQGQNRWGFLFAAVILMLANWALEARKWQLLTAHIEKLRFLQAVRAVLCGVTFAVFTPNRIGEFGGRVLSLEKGDRVKGVLASVTGSFAQLIATVSMGSLALIVFLRSRNSLLGEVPESLFWVLTLLIVAVNILLLLFYLHSRLFIKFWWKTWLLRRLHKYLAVFNGYTLRFLSRILLLSGLRYLIFLLQFFLLLRFFEVDIPFGQAIYLIALMYLVSTLLPSYAISEVSTRGSVSVALLGTVQDKPLHIAAAYFMLWLINLAIPAMVGSVLVFSLHFFRNTDKA